jgi:hypothetical protein
MKINCPKCGEQLTIPGTGATSVRQKKLDEGKATDFETEMVAVVDRTVAQSKKTEEQRRQSMKRSLQVCRKWGWWLVLVGVFFFTLYNLIQVPILREFRGSGVVLTQGVVTWPLWDLPVDLGKARNECRILWGIMVVRQLFILVVACPFLWFLRPKRETKEQISDVK